MQAAEIINEENEDRVLEYRFGDFVFDCQKMELAKSGLPCQLTLQPARLLLILLESAPETVSRQDLQRQIWDNGTTVEFEQGLNACMNQLRKVLGETASQPMFIKTLPKRGYRFAAPVTAVRTSNGAWYRRPAVAFFVILAAAIFAAAFWFQNLENDEASVARVYVAPIQFDGLNSSELEAVSEYALRLGTVDRLVRNQVEILQTVNGESLWNELAPESREPTNEYNLFLTISKSDDRGYLLDALIVDVRDGVEFDRQTFEFSSIAAEQLSDLADKVSNWSSASFGAENLAGTSIPPAFEKAYYDAMIRARRQLQIGDPEALVESSGWFDRAISIEPTSFAAKGGKAMTLAVLAGKPGFPAEATYVEALEIADEIRAAVGPTPQSELTRGFIFLYRDWDIQSARAALDLARDLAPGDATVYAWRAAVIAAEGDPQTAALNADMAVRLDPLSMAVVSDRCWYLSAARRFADAADACNWALEISPDHSWSIIGLSVALQNLGEEDEAIRRLESLAAPLRGGEANQSTGGRYHGADTGGMSSEARLARLHCELADLLNSRAQRGDYPLFELAALRAQCGDWAGTSDLLKRAKSSGESGLLFYPIDPRFDDFRGTEVARSILPLVPRNMD